MFGSTRMQTIFFDKVKFEAIKPSFLSFFKTYMYSSHQYSSRILYRKGKTMFAKVKRKYILV